MTDKEVEGVEERGISQKEGVASQTCCTYPCCTYMTFGTNALCCRHVLVPLRHVAHVVDEADWW